MSGARVMLVSAHMGGGHDAMARGIGRELAERHPGSSSVLIDSIEARNQKIGASAGEGFRLFLNHGGSRVYSALYDATRGPMGLRLHREFSERLMAKPLERAIERERPDVVVSTFPFATEALGKLRREGLDVPVVGTLIDADPHPTWFAPGVDRYLTMVPGDRARLATNNPLGKGADLPLGVVRPPIAEAPAFSAEQIARTRADFGIDPDRPAILVSGGSLSVGMDDKFIRSLVQARPDATIAVLTGRDDKLAHAVNSVGPTAVAVPWTNRVPELMRSVDAVVTNSAGMTTLESFEAGTPVILHNVVAGHGVDGAKALDADGLATYARSIDDVRTALSGVGRGDERLQSQVAHARELFDPSTPYLSDTIVNLAAQGARA